jgi:hypothetical protein
MLLRLLASGPRVRLGLAGFTRLAQKIIMIPKLDMLRLVKQRDGVVGNPMHDNPSFGMDVYQQVQREVMRRALSSSRDDALPCVVVRWSFTRPQQYLQLKQTAKVSSSSPPPLPPHWYNSDSNSKRRPPWTSKECATPPAPIQN